MRRSHFGLMITLPLVTLLTACGEGPAPVAPDVASTAEQEGPAFSQGPAGRQILMLDQCDPATFDLALGEGTCAPANPNRRGITFSTFVSLLQKHQRVEAWLFAPDRIHVAKTTTFRLPNLGGIPHSFTQVEEFGGGFVGFLNDLSGNPVPAEECVHPDPDLVGVPHPDVDLIAPGDEGEITIEPGASKKYMCCIHPWMRAVSR